MIHVDCDGRELTKGHPEWMAVCGDANEVLRGVASRSGHHAEWVEFCRSVKAAMPLVEPVNHTGEGYLSPYVFVESCRSLTTGDDVVIPCSSGGGFTVMIRLLAEAGTALCEQQGTGVDGVWAGGAIGAAIAAGGRRTVLIEGDGGFMQNLQELGTVRAQKLNLKIFLFDDMDTRRSA